MARTFPTAGQSPVDITNTTTVSSANFDHTPTMVSAGNYVNVNIETTTAGTAATWVSSLYAKITQGATKNVNGYFCAAEFETINSAANVSDNFVLVLNAQNNGAQRGSHESYIALRDYGSLAANSFLWIADSTIGSSDTDLIATKSAAAVSHTLRIIVDSTPYWFMLSDAR